MTIASSPAATSSHTMMTLSFARPRSLPRSWLWLGLGVLVFAACLVGIFARPIGFLSAFWPANALLLGILVRYPALARPAAWAAAAVGKKVTFGRAGVRAGQLGRQ